MSLSASNTETLFAVGAGDQVVAVDDQSNYPADAPKTDLSGLTPNVEAIAGYDPDLVVISDDADNIVAALQAARPAGPARARGHDARRRVRRHRAPRRGHRPRRRGARTSPTAPRTTWTSSSPTRPKPKEPLTYYHELDTTLYSVDVEDVHRPDLRPVRPDQHRRPGRQGRGGYPQLSAEHILQADPDLIFLADTSAAAQSAETVAARPGWGNLAAVKNGNVVALDDDLASRWGPRVVDLARSIADAVAKASEG